ncbi:MAG: ATP-binding cassette domain-containing protein, partial [Chloroflexota bacterium]
LAVLVSSGHASVGDMVMAITLAIQLSVLVPTVAAGNSELAEIFRAGKRYLWLADYAERVKAQFSLPESQPAPTALREGIRLEDLSLSYGGDEHFALEDLSVHLPAGSIVAIVGENGAGKTTLVKLLSRMYQPAKGAIFVNEVNLQTIEVDSWRRRITAGFQDFVRLELLAREGVGVGDLARIHDAPAVEQALVRAEAGDVVAGLPNGLETQLGRSFDGAELSGGQWQKMALARAMMRLAPLLVLLDEPTGALDAEAEFALFQRYAAAARETGQRTGAITVLVTHRFSNVRMCDLILVLAGGRLVEQGRHDELVASGGLYAELYEMQARQYR